MTSPVEILLVEDDERSRVSVARFLEDEGYEVIAVPDAEGAERALSERWRSVLIVDYKLPGKDGITLIGEVTKRRPGLPCILITAHGDIQSAVRAMKAGAFQFIEKPISPPELLEVIRQACEKESLAIEVDRLRRELNERYGFESIIGQSAPMRKVFERIRLAAPTSSTVLIAGESGTGKELVARAIHRNSPRRDGPLVAINCAALPTELVASELFGHEAGAFTGAVTARRGFFEAASGGTVFIDEVSEMSTAVQVKFLRSLEQRVITPVGSTREIPVDVRIVSATNRSLEDQVAKGEFREDLYYRLCVLRIDLPPLRERQGDVRLLVASFLRELNASHGRKVLDILPEALEALERYPWPGNVRELRNVIESIIVLSTRDRIHVEDLPEYVRRGRATRLLPREVSSPTDSGDADAQILLDGTLADIERKAILSALEKCDGNRTKAAQALGVAVRTIQRKLAEYDADA